MNDANSGVLLAEFISGARHPSSADFGTIRSFQSFPETWAHGLAPSYRLQNDLASNLNQRGREWERFMDNKVHERPVVTEANKEAVRAGHTGDHVRYVLIASCALVIIAFIVIALLVRP